MEDLRFELKQKKRKNRKGRTGTLLIVLLVLVALAAAAYGFLYRGRAPLPEKPREASVAPAPALAPAKKRALIQLYFATREEDALMREPRAIPTAGTLAEQMKSALQELIKGPTYGEAVETIPRGTKLRELFIDSQGRVYVDFSEELSTGHPAGTWSEILTVYSIVNTLAMNFSGIKDVQILLEGLEADTLAGHLDIRRPFKADPSLLRGGRPSVGADARS